MHYVALTSSPQTIKLPRGEGLDRPADFLDENGNPRRSQKITQRMVMRGVIVGKSSSLQPIEREAATAAAHADSIKNLSTEDALLQRQESIKRARAERAESRKNLIKIHDEIIQTRIEAWYSKDFVPKDATVDTTDMHTVNAPSDSGSFLDEHGNLRRISKAQEEPPVPVPLPAPVELSVALPVELPVELPVGEHPFVQLVDEPEQKPLEPPISVVPTNL